MRLRPPWAGAGLLLVCLWPSSPVLAEPCAAPTTPITQLSVEAAVAWALPCSPDVKEAESALLEAKGRLAQSRLLLSNPDLSASVDVGGGQTTAQILQPLSLAGAARSSHAAAEAQVDAAHARIQRAELEMAAAVRLAYADASVAIATRQLAEEAGILTRRLSQTVEAKLKVGEAATLDLYLARLSEAEMASWHLEALEAEADSLRLLAQWIQAPIPPEALADDPLVAAGTLARRETSPVRLDVQERQAEVRVAEAEQRLARALAMPPLSVGVFWQQDPEGTLVGPSLSMPLPLFDRNQQGRAAAAGEHARATASVQASEALAKAEIETSRRRVDAAEAALTHLQGPLLDDARAALASITAGFEAGELDLATALLLQRQVLLSESAAIKARGQVTRARLDYALAMEDTTLLGGGSR